MTVVGVVAAVIMGTWLILSVCWQVVFMTMKSRFSQRFIQLSRKWDVLGLLPTYAFFSTVPTYDLFLFHRDKLINGEWTPWLQLTDPPAPGAWIWCPSKRKTRAVMLFCTMVLRAALKDVQSPNASLQTAMGFIALTKYVSGPVASPLSQFRQFMIVRTHGFEAVTKPEILFVSPLFHLAAEPAKESYVSVAGIAHESYGGLGSRTYNYGNYGDLRQQG